MRERDEEKKNRILESTSHIIMTQGLAAVSLSKIAKEASIASGTLYTYFDNMDDMLRALYLDRKDNLAAAITQLDVTADPKRELAHFMDLVFNYGQSHLEDLLLIREFNQTPVLKQLNITPEEAASGYEPLIAFVQHGIEADAFTPLHYQVLMAYAYTPTIEYLLALNNGVFTANEVPFEQIKELSLNAVLKH